MKYIIKQIDDISGHNAVTTVEFNTDTLDGVLQHVDLFIRGCGFFPPQGATLDYIEDEPSDQEWHNEEFETPTDAKYNPDKIIHSGFYFDTERNK